METVWHASAGTMESSDVYVEIEPGKGALDIQLESVVQEVLHDHGVNSANVRIVDRGALECVSRSRVETALLRGKE